MSTGSVELNEHCIVHFNGETLTGNQSCATHYSTLGIGETILWRLHNSPPSFQKHISEQAILNLNPPFVATPLKRVKVVSVVPLGQLC